MNEWSEAAVDNFQTTLKEYAALFDDALAATRAPPASGGHPRLMILGLLEARLLSFDRVLLAGLDETVWPPAVGLTPFSTGRCAPPSASPRRSGASARRRMISSPLWEQARRSSAGRRNAAASRPSRRVFCSAWRPPPGAKAMIEPEERGNVISSSRVRWTSRARSWLRQGRRRALPSSFAQRGSA